MCSVIPVFPLFSLIFYMLDFADCPTGVSASTLTYFVNQERGLITLRTLLHICEGFNIELKEFFNDPLFDDVYDEEQ